MPRCSLPLGGLVFHGDITVTVDDKKSNESFVLSLWIVFYFLLLSKEYTLRTNTMPGREPPKRRIGSFALSEMISERTEGNIGIIVIPGAGSLLVLVVVVRTLPTYHGVHASGRAIYMRRDAQTLLHRARVAWI